MLIPYMGAETNPGAFEQRCHRAYVRFKRGMTTMQIAKMMNVSEASALRYVTIGRCNWKGLKSPYE